MELPRMFSARRALALFAVLAIATTVAARKAPPPPIAGSSIRFVGPFYSTQQSFDSTNGGQVGGEVRIYLAQSTDTLKIGDIVVYTGNNTVGTSATGSAHEKVMGVVVGGRSTSMDCSLLSADVGTTAALPNRPVIILRRGRTYVKMDTATATDTLHAGDRFKPSTLNKGKARPATSSITASGAAGTIPSGATPVTSSAANGAIVTAGAITVAGDGFNKIVGTGLKLTVPGGLALVDINVR